MAVRTKRTFSEYDKKELLEDLKICRAACIRTCTKAPIQGDVYKLATRLLDEIDNVVEVLTGDRGYLHTKQHST